MDCGRNTACEGAKQPRSRTIDVILNGAKRHTVILNGAKRHTVILNGAKRHTVILNGAKCSEGSLS
jgi:type IV secretory pathway TrbD component